jgi:DNA primase
VEGYFDVIALHQSGYENAVSPMGTALTEQQLNLLKRFSHRIVLALDSDAAGDKATIRGLQLARQTLDREQEPVFDARGLLRHESRLQADIRISSLPPGKDPDDVVNNDPQMWQTIIEKANPVVIHVMETLAAEKDIDDPKNKNEIAAQILPLIQDVSSPIERDTYLQRLARLLKVSEKSLLEIAPPRPRLRAAGRLQDHGEAQNKPAEVFLAPTLSSYSVEAHCLGILLRRPGLLYQVDRNLQQEGLSRLLADDFEHADHKSIIHVFQESIDQDLADPLEFVFNNLSLPLMELADDLLARTSELNPNEQRVLEDLMRGLLDLRRRKLLQEMEYQKSLIEESQNLGDVKASSHLQYMTQLADARRRIDHAMKKYTSRALTSRQ